MREIKFRAWDKYEDGIHCMIDHDNLMKQVYGKRGDNIFNDDTHILMQYTGLKDKNGREIYEGDIVRMYGGEYHCGMYEYDVKRTIVLNCESLWHLGESENKEIIGNIYENPELLEKS